MIILNGVDCDCDCLVDFGIAAYVKHLCGVGPSAYVVIIVKISRAPRVRRLRSQHALGGRPLLDSTFSMKNLHDMSKPQAPNRIIVKNGIVLG